MSQYHGIKTLSATGLTLLLSCFILIGTSSVSQVSADSGTQGIPLPMPDLISASACEDLPLDSFPLLYR